MIKNTICYRERGSYAGMGAALQLLRARRKVLIVGAGQRRNRFTGHAHGFLGQDGVDPAIFLSSQISKDPRFFSEAL